MHLSDTLVLGPLPLQKHPVRLPLRMALAGLLALLLAGGVALLLAFRPLPAHVAALAADQAALHGLLRTVRDRGIPLVSVTPVLFEKEHER